MLVESFEIIIMLQTNTFKKWMNWQNEMRVKIIDINKTYENKYVFSLCEDYINFCHIKIYKFDRNIKKNCYIPHKFL